jgi:hypothetical protein
MPLGCGCARTRPAPGYCVHANTRTVLLAACIMHTPVLAAAHLNLQQHSQQKQCQRRPNLCCLHDFSSQAAFRMGLLACLTAPTAASALLCLTAVLCCCKYAAASMLLQVADYVALCSSILVPWCSKLAAQPVVLTEFLIDQLATAHKPCGLSHKAVATGALGYIYIYIRSLACYPP